MRPTTFPARKASIHFWTSAIGSSFIGRRLDLAGARQRHQLLRLGQRSHHEAFDGHALVDPLHHRQAEIAAHQSGNHDLAAAREHGNRKRHRLLVAGEIDDLVEAAFGFPDDALDHVGFGRIVGDSGAVLQRRFARGGAQIRHRDLLLEHGLGKGQPHHADAAEPDQQQIALPRPVDQPLQRAVGGHAGAHQGRRLIDRQRVVIQQVFCVGHQHMAGKAAVDGDAEKALLGAEIFIALGDSRGIGRSRSRGIPPSLRRSGPLTHRGRLPRRSRRSRAPA